MRFDQAELALASDETPVGCVFVHDGKIIARGMNGTNVTMNVSGLYSGLRPLHSRLQSRLFCEHTKAEDFTTKFTIA